MGLIAKKYFKWLNVVVGPLLFAWLCFAIYRQVTAQTDLEKSWQAIQSNFRLGNIWIFVLLLLGMCMNLLLDAFKWQYLVSNLEQIGLPSALRAVCTGHAVGISTLNHLGDPLTKASFLSDGNRIRGVLVGFLGFMSHLMVVSFLGILSLVCLRFFLHAQMPVLKDVPRFVVDGILFSLLIGWLLFALFYFRVSGVVKWLEQVKWIKPYRYFLEKMETYSFPALCRLLWYSLARFVVMGGQYYLAFYLFNVHVEGWNLYVLLAAMMFTLTLVPSMALADIGIRGKVSLYLFGLYSTNDLGILSAVGILWLLNVILPAVTGTFLILSVRLAGQKKSR